MKKILAFALSLLMIVSVIPFTAFAGSEEAVVRNNLPPQSSVLSEQGATSGTCGDNLTWSYDTTNDTLTISGTGNMYDYAYMTLDIPYMGGPIYYSTAPWWKSYEQLIDSIIISDGVTSIGDNAFSLCSSIGIVVIPASVESIGSDAFKDSDTYVIYYAGEQVDWYKIKGYSNVNTPVLFNYHEHVETIDNGYPATCTTPGLTDGSHCSICNIVMVQQQIIAPTGIHTPGEWSVLIKASCTTTGTKVQKCTGCKAIINIDVIPVTGHKLGSWTTTKKATCTAKGTQVQKCTVCKKTIKTKTIKATGHKLGSWTTTKKATCTQKGTQVQKCTTCKKVIKTKTVATVKHKLVYVAAKAATKTKKAVKAHYKCSVCKKEFTDKSAKKAFK